MNEVLIGSVSTADVPRYILYGDANARPDWFVNVELLDQRCRERGWVIAPHTHPRFMQIIVCDQGGGEMSIEGETPLFRGGSILVVPPHRIHGFRYEEATFGWVITIENNYLADLLVRAPALKAVLERAGVFDIDSAIIPRIGSQIEELASELANTQEGHAIGAEIQLLSTLLLLLRHWPKQESGASKPSGSRTDLVMRFKEIVEQRYREQLNLPTIASELSISVSQLRLACKSVTGLSPIELIHDRLIAEAKRCLAYTTLGISQIADQLGFSDAGYFSRFFTKAVSQSPTVYRRNQDFGGRMRSPETAN